MPDMETLLAETFGFEMFVHVEALQKQIEDTLGRYDDSALSYSDLAGKQPAELTQASRPCGQGIPASHFHTFQKRKPQKKEEMIMKTIQELYNEIMGNEELKAQSIEAANAGKLEEFLKAHGCEATLEEVKEFLEARQKEDAPLSFDEMDNAAGGACSGKTGDLICSIAGVGIGCAIYAATSAGKTGKWEDGKSQLCEC